jgi:arabinofuranosyltransferase
MRSASREPARLSVWLGLGLIGYAVLAYQTAWLSDDAFISLRTVSNLLAGYGPRWNVGERVQTFTHPLWMFVLTAAHAITGEPFYSTLYLSWLVSCTAMACLLFVCRGSTTNKWLALFVLAFSQAFVDFSSSGLENPLTHLLVVGFAAVYAQCQAPRLRAAGLSCLCGLAAFNRLDSALLLAPALAYDALRSPSARKLMGFYLIGALPLAAWELFSLFYYGFLFPNTAYAKLTQAQGAGVQPWLDGLGYLRSSLRHDPLTLSAIAGSLVVAAYHRDRTRAWLLAGAVSYVCYTVRVGGDFMTGRFLSAPLCVCMTCLATSDWLRSRTGYAATCVLAIALAFSGRFPPPLTGADFALAPGESDLDEFGIHDERRIFFRMNSLRNAARMEPSRRDHPWSRQGFALRDLARRDSGARVQVVDAIGHAGYYAGPAVHLVDHWALADALIARLPAVFGRYGHFPRVMPRGYIETLHAGLNLIADPNLASYFDELSLVIRAPLLAPGRLAAIWRLNTGAWAAKLDQYAYLRAPSFSIHLRFTNPTDFKSVGTYVWNDFRTQAYILDSESSSGKTYDVTWQLSAHGARLSEPAGFAPLFTFQELREHGYFSISVAFALATGAPMHDLHELRYAYRRVGDELIVQRQPWPVWNGNFPDGPWHAERMPGVLQIEVIEPDAAQPLLPRAGAGN